MNRAATIILFQAPGLCREFTRSSSCFPPLGLCQLSAMINDPKRCQVLDADGLNWNQNQTLKHLKYYSTMPKAIGMTVTTGTTHIAQKWASLIKSELDANIKIIVGGPQASLAPLNTIKECPSIDYIVKGEGELIFEDIVNLLEQNKIDSISDLSGVINTTQVKQTDLKNDIEILRVNDFNNIPFPTFKDLPYHNYQCPDAIKRPMITFMTQRGCPMKCGFCATPTLHGKNVRGWSVEQILNELEYIYNEYQIREISFVDDIFSIKPSRTKKLCQGIIDRNLQFSWFGNARADMLNDEICKIMKEAGCHQMYLGFESGSNNILKIIDKGCKVQRLEYGANLLKKNNINISIGFVLGLPGENHKTIQQTIDLAKKIKPQRLQFTRWTPLAGSPLVENGMHIITQNGKQQTFHLYDNDQVGKWIQKCYKECEYTNSGWAKRSW
eukprot:116402_1